MENILSTMSVITDIPERIDGQDGDARFRAKVVA